MSWWNVCEYCGGELIEDKPYEKAHCKECNSEHRWDSEENNWFGV